MGGYKSSYKGRAEANQMRSREFRKPGDLESLLELLNGLLSGADHAALNLMANDAPQPLIFLHGAHRSGTTLFLQWLANTGLVAYPTNLLSRFYGAPLIGARIQQLLTDPRYNFRDEILDFNSQINFKSENGKTQGALSPNEFWYFWRRFLPFDDLDYLPDEELTRRGHLDGLRDELNALANVFERPFALKAMIMNQNIPALNSRFTRALFVHIKRDPVFNIQSALEARQRQYGNMDTWYSFRIREYHALKDLEPLDSVAGQIAAINRSVEHGLESVPEDRRMTVRYEDFCRAPSEIYKEIVDRLTVQGQNFDPPPYQGAGSFEPTNTWRLQRYSELEARDAWECIQARFDEDPGS